MVLVEEIDLVWWGREGNRIEVFRVAEIERGVGRIERLDVVDGDNAVARSIMAVWLRDSYGLDNSPEVGWVPVLSELLVMIVIIA